MASAGTFDETPVSSIFLLSKLWFREMLLLEVGKVVWKGFSGLLPMTVLLWLGSVPTGVV